MNELQPLPHYVKTSSKGKHKEKSKTVTIRRLWKHNQAKRHKSHKNESVQNCITTLREQEERFHTKTNGPQQGSTYKFFSFCQLAFGSYRAPKTSYQGNETRFDARKGFEVTNLPCRQNYDPRTIRGNYPKTIKNHLSMKNLFTLKGSRTRLIIITYFINPTSKRLSVCMS